MAEQSPLDLLTALRSGMTPAMMRRKQAAERLQQAQSAPVNVGLRNEGQRARDVLGIGPEGRQNQTDIQRRALLQMGLGMMGGRAGEKPGAQFSRGITSGLELLDTLRSGERQRKVESAATDFEIADSDAEREMDLISSMTGAGQKPSYGTTNIVRDEDGDTFYVTQRRSGSEVVTEYSPISNPDKEEPAGRATVLDSSARAPMDRVREQAQVAEIEGNIRNNQRRAEEALSQFNEVNKAIGLYDEAIQSVDDGALSGAVTRLAPTIRSATLALEQARRRLGLNVIQSTTFGALSQGELDLALDSAVDTSLPPSELRKDLIRRRNAQIKLMEELRKAAIYYSDNARTATPGGYLKMMEEQGLYEPASFSTDDEVGSMLQELDAILGDGEGG